MRTHKHVATYTCHIHDFLFNDADTKHARAINNTRYNYTRARTILVHTNNTRKDDTSFIEADSKKTSHAKTTRARHTREDTVVLLERGWEMGLRTTALIRKIPSSC